MPGLPTDLAAAQHGLLTAAQVRSAEINRNAVRGLVARGQLQVLSARLYRIAGAPDTIAQRLLAAVLEAGDGALSHTTALAWLGLPGFTCDPVHVTRLRGKGRREHRYAVHVHMVRWLAGDHVGTADGVPVVAPARALFELASLPGVHPAQIERAIDNAWSQRLVSGRMLHAMLDHVEGRRWPGTQMLRGFLAERGADYVPPASGLECRVVQILRRAGEAPLHRQVHCGDDDGWIGRVAFVDPEVPFILEVQSERFHSSRLDRRSDRNRLTRSAAAGYVVATVTETDVWHHPTRVLETVRRGRATARDRLFGRST